MKVRFQAIFISLITTGVVLLIAACGSEYTPKPRGYYRIDLPQHSYQSFAVDSVPFSFEYPKYSVIEQDRDRLAEKMWYNMSFPYFKATLHLSYKAVKGANIQKMLEDAHGLAYKHAMKASAIEEKMILMPEKKLYGLEYEIDGDAASSYQFFVTDSSHHFLRGALYFYTAPNPDSLSPVLDFIKEDIRTFIRSLTWK